MNAKDIDGRKKKKKTKNTLRDPFDLTARRREQSPSTSTDKGRAKGIRATNV